MPTFDKKKIEAVDRPVHSSIGASSMYRWKNCPGSVRLSEGLKSKSSVYAEEGTAAHELIGLALKRAFSENVPTINILQKTIEALDVYAKYIEGLKKDNPIHIEHSFDMDDIFPNLYGTADCVIYDKKEKLLHVIDYKHGQGLPIEVENNLQLSYYALGAMHTLDYPCHEVQMTIVQPRCYHPDGHIRSWKVSALYFIDFELDLIAAAKETKKKKGLLSAGAHCIFCPAKSICPQKEKDAQTDAKKQFAFYNDPKKDFDKIETTEFKAVDNASSLGTTKDAYDWGV